MRARRTGLLAIVAATALLGVPAGAGAMTPDLQILTATPSRDSVPVGIPTTVTFVLNVRNNGDATSGNTGSIGPVGGAGVFTNVDLAANNPGQAPDDPGVCDQPGGDAPRCRLPFVTRPQTQVVEVTDTVLATAAGTITREFTADVISPDIEGNAANNRLSATLQAVPAALPVVSKVALHGAGSLSAKQRRHAIGKLSLALDRDADLALTVERRLASGKYTRWGTWLREGDAGANTLLLSNRIDFFADPPINFLLRPMRPGTYRLTIVAIDGEGHESKPVRRKLVVPRRR